ncbi:MULTISPECIES: penicillin-binding protein activator [Rhodobacterales]|jgi:ABC-type branched-subunit amino acid transport system substrate-binding protein|uniref:ABC transporter substrate-binding protein n=1 Tax=Phaeobacter gallaeciensis TaxID=60890 RepID=A0A1B0ZV91_9RHOB|nr:MULTISPECIES: penicillin-binding protein activator [Phaeobacter]MDF1773093.1 penicillin-binding protein activator [Pseudophaeobacter sp. bin_em_oilr2.035]MEE2633690.1 penicillin-binding protein activator [Pseudomonadota bacterium]ANP38018.1 ABC transporter substrate-binding protein [Phaeobacter gallaeciensis]MDE4099838.1 penicillin-binding protein activator [Phaeobacter gallaeciensis]MDE4108693.1 penicillin-binding protein activator [Phaeobacter gallaeciensis]
MFAVFKQARKAAFAAITAISAFALSACNPTSIGSGPSINTSKPVPVALLVPRGSAKSGDSVLAQSLENAARLAIGDLKGVQVDLKVYDTAGDPATAANAATQAINDGARIILGPVYAEAANAAGVAAAKRNVNVLAFSNNTAIAGGNVFILGATFANTAQRLTEYAVRQGRGNIVIVSGNDAAGRAGSAAIQAAAGRTGATIAGSVGYELSQKGVIDAVGPIRDTARANNANAVFMTATTAGALPLLTQLLPEAGLDKESTQYIGLTRWDIPSPTLSLPGVQGGWFALPDPSKSQQFITRYSSAYGGAPHSIGGLAYDGIAAIGALVSAGKSDALTGAALTQGAGFQGTGGIFRLRADGTNERGLAVATIQEQKVVVIDPAPSSFSGTGF